MRRIRLTLTVLLTGILISLAFTTAAQATPAAATDGFLTLTNVNSGKCLGIEGASTEDFASGEQFTCTD